MPKNNTTCKICDKGYYVCKACKSHKLTPWKVHTDTVEHYKIYQVIHGYSTGVYDKIEAKLKLNNIDLSDKKEYKENIQTIIDEIIGDSFKKSEKVSIKKKSDNKNDDEIDKENIADKNKTTKIKEV